MVEVEDQFGNAIFTRLLVGQIWRDLLPWKAELSTPSMQRMLLEAAVTSEFELVRVMATHPEYYSCTPSAQVGQNGVIA